MFDEKGLGDYINDHFTRSLFRLETLELYDVSSNGDEFRRYVAGAPGPDPERKRSWMEHIRSEVARGLHTCRVHVVRSPLNDYLRFECEWGYLYNARAGEHIRILDLAESERPAELLDEDFWLIDDRDVLRMQYDSTGHFVGADIAHEHDIAGTASAGKPPGRPGPTSPTTGQRIPSTGGLRRRARVGNSNPLSDTLRQLRRAAGLSGAEAARRAGLSQSKVSRAETGSFLPAEDDVIALCRAYGAAPRIRRELIELTRELRATSTSSRVVLQRGGWWMQQRIGRFESAAARIRNFAPSVVIGLLQTEAYIAALLGDSMTADDRARMIAARLDRQHLLDSDREFTLVMAEGALRWNVGGPRVMAEQLDRLVRESRRPNMRLGIIEWTTPVRVPALHGFTIYDARAVLLGTQTATAMVTDHRDVAEYAKHWAELEAAASYDDAARAAIEKIANDYHGRP